jgi:hypothetical protein
MWNNGVAGTIFKYSLGMHTFPLKLYRSLLWLQGLYTFITALWPLVEIDSFLWVTGPKTDIWLVKTVATCLLIIGLTLLTFLFAQSHPLPSIVLGGGTALGMATIDFYYTFNDTISAIYLWDGLLELLMFLFWIFIAIHLRYYTA